MGVGHSPSLTPSFRSANHPIVHQMSDVDRGGAFCISLTFIAIGSIAALLIALVESAALPSFRRWRFALCVGTIRNVSISNPTISSKMLAVAVECGGVD